MPYCMRCGVRLPEDKEARFCPNCGAPIYFGMLGHVNMKKERRESLHLIAGKTRFLTVSTVLFLCMIVTSAGAVSKVDKSQAEAIIEEFKEMEKMLQTVGVQLIFGNNMMYCLVMFIPFVGPISGLYILYSTGKVLAASSSAVGVNPMLLFLNLMTYPYAWLEYISYSLAISESIWLSFCILKYGLKGFRAEIIQVAKSISICAVLLLVGALIEMALIRSVSSLIPP